MPGKLIMHLSYPELARLGAMLELHMGAAMYGTPDQAMADIMAAQKLSYLLAMLRRTGRQAVIINTAGGAAVCKEGNSPIKPESDPMGIDSTPDTPLEAEEGARLLALIRGCYPEDFTFEAKPEDSKPR